MKIAQNMLYISEIPNFNEKHSNLPIFKIIEKS